MNNEEMDKAIVETNNMYKESLIDNIEIIINNLNDKLIPVDDPDAFDIIDRIASITMSAFKESIQEVYDAAKESEKAEKRKTLSIVKGGK